MSGNNHSTDLQAVIFDYGEVLCHAPTAEQHAQLARHFNLGVEALPQLWERNRGAYDRGDLTPQAYWSMLAEDAGVRLRPGQMEEICELDVSMWSHLNSAVVAWARQLRSSGLRVGLLSNMHPEMVAHCRKQFAWLNDFDCVTFSADVRLIKPDPAIYRHVLDCLGVQPSEALFLDDREINIQAARALGMHAIRFQSMSETQRELQRAGFVLPAQSR